MGYRRPRVDRIPIRTLIPAILLAPVPVALLPGGALALADAIATGSVTAFATMFPRASWFALLIGMSAAALFALPIGLWRLRDARLPLPRWVEAGGLSGLLLFVATLGWMHWSPVRHLIGPDYMQAAIAAGVATVAVSIMASLVARLLLSMWMKGAERRPRLSIRLPAKERRIPL